MSLSVLDWSSGGVLAALADTLQSGHLADAVIVCTGNSGETLANVHVHQTILQMRSPFLKTLFKTSWVCHCQENDSDDTKFRLILSGVSPASVRALLGLLYFGEIKVKDKDQLFEIYKVAKMMQIELPHIPELDEIKEKETNMKRKLESPTPSPIPSKMPKKTACPQCGKHFPLQMALKQHIKKEHKADTGQDQKTHNSKDKKRSDNEHSKASNSKSKKKTEENGEEDIMSLLQPEMAMHVSEEPLHFSASKNKQQLAPKNNDDSPGKLPRMGPKSKVSKKPEDTPRKETPKPKSKKKEPLPIETDELFTPDVLFSPEKPKPQSKKNSTPKTEKWTVKSDKSASKSKKSTPKSQISTPKSQMSTPKSESSSNPLDLDLPPCPTCNKVVRNARAKEHLASHLNSKMREYVSDQGEDSLYTCLICESYRVKSLSLVARHAGLVHDKVLEVANDDQLAWLEELKGSSSRKSRKRRRSTQVMDNAMLGSFLDDGQDVIQDNEKGNGDVEVETSHKEDNNGIGNGIDHVHKIEKDSGVQII